MAGSDQIKPKFLSLGRNIAPKAVSLSTSTSSVPASVDSEDAPEGTMINLSFHSFISVCIHVELRRKRVTGYPGYQILSETDGQTRALPILSPINFFTEHVSFSLAFSLVITGLRDALKGAVS